MSRLEDRRGARDKKTGLGKSGLGGRTPVVAAVDIGASKISCFIMKPDGVRRADQTVRVAGVGYVQSRGVKGGVIVDMEEASQALAQAIERAEVMAGQPIHHVTAVTAAGQLASHRVSAQVSLGSRPIGDQDLARAISAALSQVRYANRRPIHLLPVSWSVDGQRGVADPRSIYGRVLGLELLVVSMADGAFQTLGHCLELAHVQLQGVVAAPFASALAALEDDEMELGCICIDMGAGSTSAAVFSGGALVHVDSLAVGGGHVTADIARGLSTSIAGAERIKTLHGSAIASANEDRETVEAPPRGDDPGAGQIIVPRSILKNVIAPRVEETLELVRERLRASEAPMEPGAGIVLTGGASQLAGVRELAVRVFDRPVRLGKPKRAPHLADAASGPAFCAAAGVLLRAAYGPREAVSTARGSSRAPNPNARSTVIGRVAGWLSENL
ncbi:MAG TPA: cell division protein FtsA [Caulobacteraceae bacterium]|jgi:cell division protein FtsA